MRVHHALRIFPLLLTVSVAGCGGTSGDVAARSSDASDVPAATDWFVDASASAGLEFVHVNGASGQYFYPEILPPGVALLDYDDDGDLDAFIVQGHALETGESGGDDRLGRLYRNDLTVGADGETTVRLVDVTEGSGLEVSGFGLGVATGDVDNDGRVDLLVTTFEATRLFRNQEDGAFLEVTADSGIEPAAGFGVSASFVDYDHDGWLDLYVGHNVSYGLDNTIECNNRAAARDYCPPETYGGTPDHLYRNLGDGRFEDVSETALIDGQYGPALGVSTADYDGDGLIDIYVANDATENLLWINQGDGTFRDRALLGGVAVSGLGLAEASMGVDAGDYDNDGDEDLFMTHITGEGNNLYENDGAGVFQDVSNPSGLGPGSFPYTGWGTTWFDYDNDGWLDLLAINGTVLASQEQPDAAFPYEQPDSLFRNLGDGTFEDVTAQAGAVFTATDVGRGAAFGDIDNDGDVDVLVGNDAGPARLVLNSLASRGHWLGLRLVGGSGRDMIGARVAVIRPDTDTLWRRARSDGSYASANDPRVHVGLGETSTPPTVEVHWPDGHVERWDAVAIDRWTTLRQGEGTPVS